MNYLPRFLRYTWAAPATVLGVLVAIPACLLGARAAIIDGVVEVAGGRLGDLLTRMPSSFRFAAITFGHIVIAIDERALAGCRAHEHVHVRQYERWGIFFFPLYFASSAWQLVRGRSPYWHNYFERQARDLGKNK